MNCWQPVYQTGTLPTELYSNKADGGNRTHNLLITGQLLYQLSYASKMISISSYLEVGFHLLCIRKYIPLFSLNGQGRIRTYNLYHLGTDLQSAVTAPIVTAYPSILKCNNIFWSIKIIAIWKFTFLLNQIYWFGIFYFFYWY